MRKLGSWFRLAFSADRGPHAQELIVQLVDLATKARKEGMLPLENLDAPETLGPLIAGAFVATLWGVLTANLFWLPMGAKITRISELQAAQMELLVEGITEIQAGTSPRAVRLKLNSLIPPSELAKEAA